MPRTEVYQLRLTKEEKELLAARAKESGLSIAGLIRAGVGLGYAPRTAGIKDLKEARPFDDPQKHNAVYQSFTLSKMVKQLEAQGKSPEEAESLARRRLGMN